ncbi:DUF3110 domain-containing protein [Anabaena sp. FACHB-1237]|uniref:DUF3110 domain-containing protein n=1 Tax=Anabaena sp. FACHB-1237 TaxID=2692769 RepID=UPI001680C9A6|nr:DUF3110 domain-containing protein [Anabaena sp. FACHB-1237]MBD2138967.1 DUF3110 domain-containing protein [Anabaena sp. FACHB-1237]
MSVFVLIFNAGTDNEGVHSIRSITPDGLVRNKILMFESEDDATRFALMLEAQDFPEPTVEKMSADDIKEFCQSAGYDWEFIPKDQDLVIPPETNVDQTDWESQTQTKNYEESLNNSPSTSEMSNSDLDDIRRRLEGLL